MANVKKYIPDAITCGNLFCGCLAVVSAFNNNLVWSAYLVGIAAVLDFFDGFVARLLKTGSEMGKQLDSLADMVTFGLVPAVVIFQLLKASLYADALESIMQVFNPDLQEAISVPSTFSVLLLPFIAFTITIFSAIRLAKFNIDTRQSDSFIGVPTPANAILICSIPLIRYHQPYMGDYNLLPITSNHWFLAGITIVMSYLLVAELPLFALKFKNFSWTDNKIRYSFLIISLLLLILFQFIAIPFIIFLYIVLSIFNNIINKNHSNEKL